MILTNENEIFQSENYKIYPLEWDTDYFGISSGRIDIMNKLKKEEKEDILKRCDKYKFITISNFENCNENNVWIGQQTTAFIADINIQFIKSKLNENKKKNKNIKIENNFLENFDILNIAKSSFKYSRFFNDPYLPEKEKKSIYVEWVKSSFNKQNKYFAYSYSDSGIVDGFILVDVNEKIGDARIELIAVGEEFKGNKVGSKLIQELETFLSYKNIKNIFVGTQVNNISAINFYRRNGFIYRSCQSIYHLWK